MYQKNPTSDKTESNLFSVLLLNVSEITSEMSNMSWELQFSEGECYYSVIVVILSFLGAFLSVSD